MNGPWNEDHLAAYLPDRARTAVIVGANEGQWVKRCSPLFDRVVAIEPDAANVAMLIDLNLHNVSIVAAAAWMTEGHTLPFHVRDHQPMSGALAARDIRRNDEVSRTIEMNLVTIDSLNLVDCDFLIVDTEGAELDVMRGATQTIERCKPDLIIECHEIENRIWLASWLERCGYNLAHIHDPAREMNDEWQRFVHLVCHHYRPRD
jgi:FkbM family methyltransferase